jgi:tRNA threonylcarbamoyl adenosine modification protein YeaZ
MNTLAIDTSTPRGSVAFLGNEIAFERGGLFTAIQKLRPGNYDEIIVGVGPGSFTGIRAGIAAAKGLALPRRVPILPACSFDAIALTALPGMPRDCPQMCVLGDARRDEVYFAFYDRTGQCTQDCRIAALESIELHNPIWFVSSEVEKYRDALRETFGGFASACEAPVFPRAAALRPAELPLEPIYLRETDYKKV